MCSDLIRLNVSLVFIVNTDCEEFVLLDFMDHCREQLSPTAQVHALKDTFALPAAPPPGRFHAALRIKYVLLAPVFLQ